MNNDIAEKLEQTKKYSIIDGSAYNIMSGFCEQYINPFALRLGALGYEIAILSSVPFFIGSLCQIFGAKLADKLKTRKKIIVTFVLFQAFSIVPLFILPLLTKNILFLTLLFSLYLAFSNMAAPSWNSLIGDIVDEEERADYFSKRNRTTIIFSILSVIFAGIIINYFSETNIWMGFGVLFSIAMLGRLVSWYFLAKHYDPEYHPQEKIVTFREFLQKLQNTDFGKFVVFRTAITVTIMIAAPFFVVYMLRDLGFTYIQYTAIVLIAMVVKVISMKYWGWHSKKFGNRNIMYVSALVISLIPLWWFISGFFFEGQAFIFYLILFAEATSGFGWAGFELTTFNYMLETSNPGIRAKSFAYFNVIWGTGLLIGGIIGSILIVILPDAFIGLKTILLLFAISTILRFTVSVVFASRLREIKVNERVDIRRLFFDVLVSHPFSSASNRTKASLNFAEKNFWSLKNETVHALNSMVHSFGPHIRNFMERMDYGENTKKNNKIVKDDLKSEKEVKKEKL